MTLPVFDLNLAPPGRFTLPTFTGGGTEGGRTLTGSVRAMDLTGGGLLTTAYKNIQLGNTDPARLRYWSMLGAMLNSRVRSILVPLMTEFIVNQDWVVTFHSDAALNAGTVTLDIANMFLTDDPFVGGEWFEVAHAAPLYSRCYCITDIDSATQITDRTYRCVVGIRSPLRAAVTAGTAVNLVRPKATMSLAPNAQISAEIEKFWWATPDVSFLESFPTE